MIRDRFHYEAPDVTAGAAPAAVEDGAGAEPATPVDVPVPSGGETPAPPWTDSLEFREAVNAASEQQLQAYLAQYGDGEPDGGQPFEQTGIDPYADDFGEQITNVFASMLDERLGPIQQAIQAQQAAEQQAALQAGNEAIKDVLHDLQQTPGGPGEFQLEDSVARAEALARDLAPRYFQAYGQTDRAAEMAIAEAYKQQRAYEDQLIARGRELYKNELATLAGAPDAPAAASVTGVEQPRTGFRSLQEWGRARDMQQRPTI